MSTVIIGAGHAGTQCAVSLRSEGYEGDIVLINDDVSVPYHKPPLSKKYLRADNPEATALRAASAYEKASINWIHGQVESVDIYEKTVRMNDGTSQGYSQLVFATGARNRTLPNLSDCNNVFSLRTVGDAEALHQACQSAKTVAVLGGGFIGLEVAACLAEMGKVVRTGCRTRSIITSTQCINGYGCGCKHREQKHRIQYRSRRLAVGQLVGQENHSCRCYVSRYRRYPKYGIGGCSIY